jgi:hypothetical protein
VLKLSELSHHIRIKEFSKCPHQFAVYALVFREVFLNNKYHVLIFSDLQIVGKRDERKWEKVLYLAYVHQGYSFSKLPLAKCKRGQKD